MAGDLQKEAHFDVLLLKFVVSAIIDKSSVRPATLKYIRANLDLFSEIVGAGPDGLVRKTQIQELLEFLESGDKRPTFSGKPPKLRLVRSNNSTGSEEQ